MNPFPFSKAQELGKILSKVPLEIWDRIVGNEPEAMLLDQLPRYGFGKFATLMIIAALNDYQLKGPAEEKYWPPLHMLIRESLVPETLEDMKHILSEFYMKERFREAKLKRLNKFLDSHLAQKLWTSNPEDVSNDFKRIWVDLSRVMGQKRSDKTIVFAMKTLGLVLTLIGHTDFDFSEIPIPVDVRVKRLTAKLVGRDLKDEEVRHFWDEVLKEIRKTQPGVNMIHLDSLVWQIGQKNSCSKLISYFGKFQVPHLGRELCKLITNTAEP